MGFEGDGEFVAGLDFGCVGQQGVDLGWRTVERPVYVGARTGSGYAFDVCLFVGVDAACRNNV